MTDGSLTPDEIAAVRKPYRAASLLPGRAYHDPAIHEFERSEWFRRDWMVVGREEDAPESGHVLPGQGRRRAAPRRPRPRRRPSRVLQRLPAPRHRGRRGAVRQGRPLPVPVPRLDLRPRWAARPGQAHRGPRGLLFEDYGLVVGPAGDLAGLRLRQPHDGPARADRLARRPRPAPRAVRLRVASRRPRRRSTRSTRTGSSSPRTTASATTAPASTRSSIADAVRRRRRLRAGRAVAGRLDGARRRRRDHGARRRASRRPPGHARHHASSTSGGSTTTCSGRRRSCRSTPTTCSSTGSSRPAPDHTRVICQWLFEPATIAAPRLRPVRRHRVLGPDQSPGLARLRAPAARHAVAELDGRPLLEPGAERPRLRPDGWSIATRTTASTRKRTVRLRYDVPPPKDGDLTAGDVPAVRLPTAASTQRIAGIESVEGDRRALTEPCAIVRRRRPRCAPCDSPAADRSRHAASTATAVTATMIVEMALISGRHAELDLAVDVQRQRGRPDAGIERADDVIVEATARTPGVPPTPRQAG